ncbi:AAA-type ATPase family protein [Reticulomyxa filosa]|uniref:AAA-type ATPase family protein n=1 Tax=Reticulomyxa filosa TaxID=46433 RepID=X6PBZ2_RETFI|nr:AAA-type ATPase family protein [Reticulomyxa filosa]|eukprot:ETO35579.1 AAA-type ATPase family protein [Reticulomyxa filosa]
MIPYNPINNPKKTVESEFSDALPAQINNDETSLANAEDNNVLKPLDENSLTSSQKRNKTNELSNNIVDIGTRNKVCKKPAVDCLESLHTLNEEQMPNCEEDGSREKHNGKKRRWSEMEDLLADEAEVESKSPNSMTASSVFLPPVKKFKPNTQEKTTTTMPNLSKVDTNIAALEYLSFRPSLTGDDVMVTSLTTGQQMYIYNRSQTKIEQQAGTAVVCFLVVSLTRKWNTLGSLKKKNRKELEHKEIKEEKSQVDSQLWAEKYSPQAFTDLLSDEKINRQVLHWVKSWDMLVYGHKYCRGEHDDDNETKGNKTKSRKKMMKKVEFLTSMLTPLAADVRQVNNGFLNAFHQTTKHHLRPEFPIILLAGPPGCGKTTLAHVIAKHCGYRPVEFNARF